jgi:protein-tyrosine kinase
MPDYAKLGVAMTSHMRPLLGYGLDSLPVLELSADELDRRRIVGFESRDARSRPYNLLRAQMLKEMLPKKWRLIGVTSATPGAGKTFNSLNLAAALSCMSKATVVLCDFDLRRGSIAKAINIDVEHGIGSYLKGETKDPADIAMRINDSQLVVFPTKATSQGSSELLSSDAFADFVKRLRALPEETIVICDLPPVFANDDAIICMQHLDAYLLIVDHGITTAGQIEECINLLQPAPCLGTILNRYRGGFADPYGYGYGDAYGLKDYG